LKRGETNDDHKIASERKVEVKGDEFKVPKVSVNKLKERINAAHNQNSNTSRILNIFVPNQIKSYRPPIKKKDDLHSLQPSSARFIDDSIPEI
jgi:hypothetical protein